MTLWGENNPQANPEAVVTSGKARFTVLTPEMIRIEYSDKGFFEDRATFTVVNRNLAVPHYSKSEDATFLYIETDKLKMKYRKGTNPRTLPPSSSNLSITLNHNGREVLWYPGKPDPLNLKGTCRTLDGSNGQNKRSEMEDGLISRSGWAVIEDSWTSSRSDGSRSFAFERRRSWATTGGQSGKTLMRLISISWVMAATIRRRCLIIRRSPARFHCRLHMCSVTGIANILHIRQMTIVR